MRAIRLFPAAFIFCLAVAVLLTACAGPTAATPPPGGPTAALPEGPAGQPTALPPPGAETSLPVTAAPDLLATAKAQTAVAAETAMSATLAVVTPTPAPPVVITLPLWPEQILWLPPGTAFLGETYPEMMLLVRNTRQYMLHDLNSGLAVATGELPIPDTLLAISPDAASVLGLADGSSTATGPVKPGPHPVIAYTMAGATRYTLPDPSLYSAGYTTDGKFILGLGLDECAIRLFNPADGSLVRELTGFETASPVYSGFLVPGGRTAVWQARATIQLQDVESGAMGAQMNYQDFVNALAFSPDGSRMAVSVDGSLILYSLPDGSERTRVTLSQPISSLDFSPDGKTLAAAYGADIQLWEAEALAPRGTIRGPNTLTNRVTFSPDGAYLVAQHEGQMLTIHAIILE